MYTHIEDYINELYALLSISLPEQLDIDVIAKKMNITFSYGSSTFLYGNYIRILKSTKQKEWQLFGHEVCHYLRHYGHQLTMHSLFRDLQEYQANHFAYHFCVPTFMLEKIPNPTVNDIVHLFNVEFDFACRRLEMYQNKLYFQGGYHGRGYIVGC